MIKRCYSDKFLSKNKSYVGCEVCDEWLIFSNFKKWMVSQEWENCELDKDIICYGNKVYSPDTCCFIPASLNLLLNTQVKRRGALPLGVSFDNYTGRYKAEFSNGRGRRINLGRFDNVSEAAGAYIKEKCKAICEIAMGQTDTRVKKGLLVHAVLLEGLS
jgi:hypothetical protein